MEFTENHRFYITALTIFLFTIMLLFDKISLEMFVTFISGLIAGVINPTTYIKENVIQ